MKAIGWGAAVQKPREEKSFWANSPFISFGPLPPQVQPINSDRPLSLPLLEETTRVTGENYRQIKRERARETERKRIREGCHRAELINHPDNDIRGR